MSEESEEDKCNCKECYGKPLHSLLVIEGNKEPTDTIKTESGLKRGFLNPKKTADDSTANKRTSDVSSPSTPHHSFNELLARHKPKPIPKTIECEKITTTEVLHDDVKIEMKCTKCIENNDIIDLLNQGAFRVSCSEGCLITMHRTCFEKALGSGKKKELKSSKCPCDSSVAVITHRSPGRIDEFKLWLRCEGKEPERPKKEDKTKEKKEKERKDKETKFKKDSRNDDENRKLSQENNSLNTPPSTGIQEERPVISLTPSLKPRDEDVKKNLIKPLPADLNARPIERKEDALMSKYAVKETATKEATRKKKKEVRQVILPGLTVKGQRGKKDEHDDTWNANETEETEDNPNGMESTDLKYEEGPYGFAMPEEVGYDGTLGGIDWNREEGGEMMTNNMEMNNYNNSFHHPLPIGHGVFRPTITTGTVEAVNSSSQPLNDHTGRNSLSGFTESPIIDEPPLIENPFDYPNLVRDDRSELINFFDSNTPILEENAALFDSPQIDLEQLMNMLENFIELQFYGNEQQKRIMTETLHTIFVGEVESDIIPFLIDLQCFKYGYVDGRLVVSVKTEGRERREREEVMRREREEEDRRKKEEEGRRIREREEEERRNEERKKEEVRRVVMELEERRRREVEERRLIEEESIRMEEEKQRKKNEEEKRMEEERRINEEAKAIEKQRKEEEVLRKRRETEEEERKALEDEQKRKDKEEEIIFLENQKRILEEKRQKEEERERIMQEPMNEEEEMRRNEVMRSKKDVQKKTKEKELERKTREAINTLRKHDESKNSSSESSPERKELIKCARSSLSSAHSIPPLPPPSSSSSSSFSTSALPFIPKHKVASKAEVNRLNPNAPAFVPYTDAPTLIDENGTEVDEMWIDVNKQILEENRSTIEELNRRIAELETEKMEMVEKNRLTEIEMSTKDGKRVKEDLKYNETISHLQAQVREKDEQIIWKDSKISEIAADSEKKTVQLNQKSIVINLKLEEMKTKMQDYNTIIYNEKREKDNALKIIDGREETKRLDSLERRIGCARDAVIVNTHIINKLAGEVEAQVMTSIFIDLRRKWMDHYSTLKYAHNAHLRGETIDWNAIFSLREPSMPRETDELVKECYVWHYQTIHSLSFRLAGIVKRCLRDHQRNYEDAFIIGVIQKWMRIHKDPTKIDATVPQVANMVCIALGDMPLMPPKYVHVSNRVSITPPATSAPSTPSTPTLTPTLHTQMRTQSSLNKNDQPKGWKKASDKVRQVDRDHECSICLEDTEGGDISYCEQISCNEPYHNDCLDQYWKTGGRFCPRCRTPMPPRDAYPALA